MSVLAARGAARLPGRWRPAAVAIVAVDLALCSPLPMPLPVAPDDPPAAAQQLNSLPPGPVLVLPAAGPGVHFQRPLLDQRVHRRPLLMSPNRPGLSPAIMQTETGRWMAGLAFSGSLQPPDEPQFPLSAAVILVMPGYADAVATGFGPPDVVGTDGSAAWARPTR